MTTSIPYVNARPHVGFALELVQADAIARYNRLLGKQVCLQTGSDENAFKIVLAARAEGLSPGQLVDRNAEAYRRLGEALSASVDSFIRTTERRHRRGVHDLWRRLRPGDVYKKHYRGLYCNGCEDFLLQKDLVEGRCPEHGKPPVEAKEQNYFFRLSAYQGQIEELLASDQVKVIPEKRKNEVLRFVRAGLEDFSISRAAGRSAGWGIPVPDDPSQVIYVWFDALTNYLSGPGFGTGDRWRDFWNEQTKKIHVLGKNVWKFHAVYWPAILLSAGLPLPDEIVVHGFVTENGRKISKSLGNTVDPFACVERFGSDGVRYYLLRAVPPFDDGDFSTERLPLLYNAELANGLGNLVSRLTRLSQRAAYGRHAGAPAPRPPDGFREALSRCEFDKAIRALWGVITHTNRDIERARPWEAPATGDPARAKQQLWRWLDELHRIGYWLSPFLPGASAKILAALRQDPISACAPLFPRVR